MIWPYSAKRSTSRQAIASLDIFEPVSENPAFALQSPLEAAISKWVFQTTPHDGWDFDGVSELVSFDMEKDGKAIQAGATADRNGFFHVLDRTAPAQTIPSAAL